MSLRSLRTARRLTELTCFGLLLGLVALFAVSAIGPRFGYQVLVIRGGSMAPSIPLGAVVVIGRVDPTSVAVGDVVSIQTATGVIFTHRVIEIRSSPDGPGFVVKGDANAEADGPLIPAAAVVGRVAAQVPGLGYLVALLSMPTGLVSILSGLASLLLAAWLLGDLERETRETLVMPAPAGGAP
jgi:signal peptidase